MDSDSEGRDSDLTRVRRPQGLGLDSDSRPAGLGLDSDSAKAGHVASLVLTAIEQCVLTVFTANINGGFVNKAVELASVLLANNVDIAWLY